MNWLDFEVKRSKRKVTGKYTNMVEIHWQGDAENEGVEIAGVEIAGEGEVWKVKVLKMCF